MPVTPELPIMSARRAFMWLTGLSIMVLYAGAALLAYALLRLLVARPPDPGVAALVIGVVTVVGAYLSYRFGTTQLLAGIDAVEIGPRNAPTFFQRLDRLAGEMAVQRPRVFVAELGAPNAFALGGVRSGALVVDRSLFRLLSPGEREAIVAHELAHLESYDAFVQTLAYSAMRTLVGLVLLPLLPLLLLVVGAARAMAWIRGRPNEWSRSPLMLLYAWASLGVTFFTIALTALIRAHSRRREYRADDRAVEVTGDPLALARALRTIERASKRQRGLLSTLYVSGDEEGILTRLLSTHPPMDDRIERLVGRAELDRSGRHVPVG